MKRIEKYKHQLERACQETQDSEKLLLVFQEKMNQLHTYDDKKAFYDHFEALKDTMFVPQ